MNIEHDDVERVMISQGRWSVRFTIRHRDGTKTEYIASADSGLTFRDGIWFGTPEEERAALEAAW